MRLGIAELAPGGWGAARRVCGRQGFLFIRAVHCIEINSKRDLLVPLDPPFAPYGARFPLGLLVSLLGDPMVAESYCFIAESLHNPYLTRTL